jgi:pectin methylesterase-like acyl-CoA thioesterase
MAMLVRFLKYATSLYVVFFIPFSSLYADFYVIPIAKKMKNIVTVAKSGAQFRDIQQAINSINDANDLNPYVVYVASGIYNVDTPIEMKPYVSLLGSGKKSTIIDAGVSSSQQDGNASAVVSASNVSISNLSVYNYGSGEQFVSGIFSNNGYRVELENVHIEVQGDLAYAVYNDASYVNINNSELYATAVGTASYAIYNRNNSPLNVKNSTLKTFSKSDTVYGIRNTDSDNTKITNCTIEVSTTADARGIYLYNSDNVSILDTQIKARSGTSSGDDGYAIHADYSNDLMIRNVISKGTTYGLNSYYSNIKASLSTIMGGANNASCSYCVDENGAALDSTCN